MSSASRVAFIGSKCRIVEHVPLAFSSAGREAEGALRKEFLLEIREKDALDGDSWRAPRDDLRGAKAALCTLLTDIGPLLSSIADKSLNFWSTSSVEKKS